jgi:hypothetical protein
MSWCGPVPQPYDTGRDLYVAIDIQNQEKKSDSNSSEYYSTWKAHSPESLVSK